MDYFWEHEGWEQQDKHLKQLAQSPFKRAFPFIPNERGLYIIRGPRQVGKSTWIKYILQHYTSQPSWKNRCLFINCDPIKDYRELLEILRSAKDRELIILDEITFVDEWDRAIKDIIDAGHEHTFVITGSNAADLRRGMDRMPGRFGSGGEYILMPMDFDEFSEVRLQAGWRCNDRLEELKAFMKIGGFPSAVLGAGNSNKAPEALREEYKRWLVGDIRRLGKQEILLRETMGVVAMTMTTSVSLQKLAQKTQMGSHHTAQDYIQALEDCFALRTLYAIDEHDFSLRFRKEKKFYFTDPGIFWMALDWYGMQPSESDFDKVAEGIAHEHLARREQRMGYLSSKKGEVDFFIPPHKLIEVKWSPIVRNLSRAYLEHRSPDKKVWYQGNFLNHS